MPSLKAEVRMLLIIGVACAAAASYLREDDKSFNLWSNTSSICVGAAIGILKETYGESDNNDRH